MEDTGIKQWFANGFKSKQEVAEDEVRKFDELNEERIARGKKPFKWEELYDEKKAEAKA